MPDAPQVIAGVLGGGAGAPAPGLGAPAPGLGAPAPGSGARVPGSGAPAPGSGAPAPGPGAASARELGRLFFVVGAFDGLHRGHVYLLARLRAAAARHQARPGVITFDHHPDEILVGVAPPVLCDPAERLVRFGRAGVDVVVVQHFDAAVRMTPYQDFVAALAQRVELAGFLMTPDAAFGHERQGTPSALAKLGRTAGFAVDVVEPLSVAGRPVRSTEIRALIAAGDLQGARHLLGRSVTVVGRVVSDRAAAGPVMFDLPVALPPAGRYRVEVEPAWAPGLAQADRPLPGIGTVGNGGSLSLDVGGSTALAVVDPAGRIRTRFVGPA